MNQQIPQEMIKKHYNLIVTSILHQVAVSGSSLTEVISKTVFFFGLVPVQGQPEKYELLPELRKKADAATTEFGERALPLVFSEDEAIIFCACTTAALDIHGELDNFANNLKTELANLEAELAAKGLLKHDPQGIPQESKPVSKLRIVTRKDDDGGPTFH